MSYVIGIDPGLSGAIAAVDTYGGLIGVFDMPTVSVVRNKKNKKEIDFPALAETFRQLKAMSGHAQPDSVFVEKVGSMPGQGVSSMFAFGKATGAVLAMPHVFGWPVDEVPPATWKKYFGLNGTAKDHARALAVKLFGVKHLTRKKDVGRADALLIALYGADKAGGKIIPTHLLKAA